MARTGEQLLWIAIALAAFPGIGAIAQERPSREVDAILANLRSSDTGRFETGRQRWRQGADGGVALLPQVLPLLGEVPNSRAIAEAIGALHAEQPTAVGDALQTAAMAPEVRSEVIRLLARLAPARLIDDDLVAVHSSSRTSNLYELARATAERAAAEPTEVAAYLALLHKVPVDRKNQVLQAALSIHGSWRKGLWPALQPYLPTSLCQNVVQLLAPHADDLPAFIAAARAVLTTGTDAQVATLAWSLQFQPPLARSLAGDLVAASRSASAYALRHCLRALARVSADTPGVRELVLTALVHEDREVRIEAMRACALLRLRGDDVVSALVELEARAPGSRVARSARAWQWSQDPTTGMAPPAEDVAAAEASLAVVAAASLADAVEPPGKHYLEALGSALRHRDDDVVVVAARAVARLGEGAAAFAPVLFQRLASVHRELRPLLLDALLAMGDEGLAVVGRSMLTRELQYYAQWVDSLGDRGLPAWVATAGQAARATGFRVSLPWQQPEVLATLPARAQQVLTDPRQFLRQVAGDPTRPGAARAAAFAALKDLVPDELGECFAIAIAAVDDAEPAVRAGAMGLLRRWGPQARDALSAAWLSGRVRQRHFAGALLRELERAALPPMPPWIARPCLQGDLQLRVQAAVALLAAGDAGPALELLREKRTEEITGRVLGALVQYGVPETGHLDTIAPLLTVESKSLRAQAIELVMRAGVAASELQAQVWRIPENRRLVLGTRHPWSRELATAVLADLMGLSRFDRDRTMKALAQQARHLLPPSSEMATAMATAWRDAESWKDRARLVDLSLALHVELSFAKPDIARMVADPRDEIRDAGRVAGASLGDRDVLEELRQQLRAEAVAERVAALRALVASGNELPDWVSAADLVRLSANVPLDDLLMLMPGWTPKGADADRTTLAKLLLVVYTERRQALDTDRLAAVLLQLWRQAKPLLVQSLAPGRGPAIESEELMQAIARQRPGAVLELASIAPPGRLPMLLHAVGYGRDESLAKPLLAMLDTDDAQLRMATISALRCVGPAALPEVLLLLRQEPLDLAALHGLAEWGTAGGAAVTDLMDLARRSDDPAEHDAITAVLAALGPRGVVSLEVLASEGFHVERALWVAVESEDEDISIAALRALVATQSLDSRDQLARVPIHSRSPRWQRWLSVVRRQLGEVAATPASFARLAAGLVDSDPRLRLQTVAAITQDEPWPSPVAALLVEALWDPDAEVRLAAAEKLTRDPKVAARASAAIDERLATEPDERVRRVLTGN